MGMEEDDVKPVTQFAVGDDLTSASIEELEKRITLLNGEIERIRTAIDSKQRSRGDAESFFRT